MKSTASDGFDKYNNNIYNNNKNNTKTNQSINFNLPNSEDIRLTDLTSCKPYLETMLYSNKSIMHTIDEFIRNEKFFLESLKQDIDNDKVKFKTFIKILDSL
jgi:hypothetical protein